MARNKRQADGCSWLCRGELRDAWNKGSLHGQKLVADRPPVEVLNHVVGAIGVKHFCKRVTLHRRTVSTLCAASEAGILEYI